MTRAEDATSPRRAAAEDGDPRAAPSAGSSLELAAIGNCRIGALVDTQARVVWMCVPRFDGDPVFCNLLDAGKPHGTFAIELEHCVSIEQDYLSNTPVLRTVMRDRDGAQLEIVDFCPRFAQYGRMFTPVTLVRIVTRLAGRPRVRVRFDPACDYGAQPAPLTHGSHHVRALVPSYPLRLTTDAPITQIVEQRAFFVEHPLTLVLGPDETLADSPTEVGRRMLAETLHYWRGWVRSLSVPFEWQHAVIRAAITLKLNTFDDTGGIIAALTTSIPEAPHTVRNWDYRFCWLRDAYFVVNALNRLGATATMERFLQYVENVVAESVDTALQPVYSLSGVARLDEVELPREALAGYRGMGPVRVGNLAYEQVQHDVYGAGVLGTCHLFFDARLTVHGDADLFVRLERLGERAWAMHDQPDAGIWEYRGRQSVHTFSSMMCWAACDRLARIAQQLGLADRRAFWADRAATIHALICRQAWNPDIGGFAGTFGGAALDASLLLMGELEFLSSDDPRLRGTIAAIERHLRRGDFLMRYIEPDDFGEPETAFLVCTFWWIQALAKVGQHERARELFEKVLARRNRFGLLSEDIDTRTGELWGNFPQTYSMVGIIMCAMRLSRRWDGAF